MNDINKSCEILGVRPDTPIEGIKQSYRDLVKIWHPDRFNNDPRLQHKAQEKLKEINRAYKELCNVIIDKDIKIKKGGKREEPENEQKNYSGQDEHYYQRDNLYNSAKVSKIAYLIKEHWELILTPVIIGGFIIFMISTAKTPQKAYPILEYPKASSIENQTIPKDSSTNFKPIAPVNNKLKSKTSPLINIPSEPINPVSLPLGSSPLGVGIRNGNSLITVDNGTSDDALIKLIRFRDNTEEVIRNFYIPAGKKYTANKIPQGQYRLKVAFGKDWNRKLRKYNYNRHFSKTEPFDITETKWTEPVEDGYVERTRYTKMDITLHKVMHGNFKSHEINEEDFEND